MPHHGNSVLGEAPDNIDNRASSFEFHGGCAAFLQQSAGRAYRFILADLIGQERHVGNNQSALDSTANCPCMVDHHFESDRNGVFETQHHHPHGIADEDDVDSGAIE